MIPLYNHQKKIIEENPLKSLMALGTGTGKSRICLELAEGSTLIVVPKQLREDKNWQRNAEKFGIICNLTVISKEDLRSDWDSLPAFDTVIFDECHNHFGVLPETRQRKGVQIPKTSQVFEATFCYLRKFPPKRLYFASATPVTKPMNLWAVATLLGVKWDFFRFREKYYLEMRMGQRRIWIAKKDEATKLKMIELIKRFGFTGSISDFADVPDQNDKTVYIDLSDAQKKALKELSLTEADALVRLSRARTIENGVLYGKKIESISEKTDVISKNTIIFPSKKIDYILERAIEFPKLLVFANYTAQIETIAEELRKEGYKVLTLTGSTKDRGTVIQEAENSKECIVVAQSSVSSGWELPSFPCVIFASLSYRVVDHTQARGRVLRMNKLKKNLYIYLVIKGGVDDSCYKSIMDGHDFIERVLS